MSNINDIDKKIERIKGRLEVIRLVGLIIAIGGTIFNGLLLIFQGVKVMPIIFLLMFIGFGVYWGKEMIEWKGK